jgi:hypothetical protein
VNRRWDTGDRISASMVYANMAPTPLHGSIPIYSFDLAGIIMSPTANKLLCGYPFDVGSLERFARAEKRELMRTRRWPGL